MEVWVTSSPPWEGLNPLLFFCFHISVIKIQVTSVVFFLWAIFCCQISCGQFSFNSTSVWSNFLWSNFCLSFFCVIKIPWSFFFCHISVVKIRVTILMCKRSFDYFFSCFYHTDLNCIIICISLNCERTPYSGNLNLIRL